MSSAMNAFAQQTWYELLEVPTTASRTEILDAYTRAMETYSPDSVAVYTLVAPDQIEALRQRLTQARDVLAEVEQRLLYDAQIGVKRSPEEQARLRAEVPPAPVAAPPEARAGEPAAPPPVQAELEAQPVPEAEAKPIPEVEAKPEAEAEVKPEVEAPPVPEEPMPAETRPPEPPTAPVPPTAASPGASRSSIHGRPSAPVARRSVGVVASASRPGLRPLPTPGTRPALQPSAVTPASEPASSRAPAPTATAPMAPAAVASAAPVPSPAASALTALAVTSPPAAAGPGAPAASPDSALTPASAQARDSRARPKVFFEIPPDAEFNGELLRRVRESRGLTLQTLAERTRISSKHMDNIEADRYEALPATVYLRGMLMSVARELGLDPLRVCRSYMGLVASAEKKRR